MILIENNINQGLLLGFLFEISKNYKALNNFSKLDEIKITQISSYIQNSPTEYESQKRINLAIENLEKNNLEFLN